MNTQEEDRLPERSDSLDDLFDDAMLTQAAKNRKIPKAADPSMRNALDAAAKKMKELYTLPENWEAGRGLALIDKGTQTLVGNFREYTHRSISRTRKLIREHGPIAIDSTEVVEGYLGEQIEMRLRGQTWEVEHEATADLWLDELMVGAPAVQVRVKTRLGAVVRVDLAADVQFASVSGGTLFKLPAGTDILSHLSIDSKSAVRKAAGI